MRQAWSETELALGSSKRQRARWYLAVHKPETLGIFTMDATPDTHPVSAIEVTNISGVASAASEGLTLWLGSQSGASDLGRVRLRKKYIGDNPMPVMESGSGLVRWNDVTHITVKEEFRPWVRHPRYNTATSSWKMDYEINYGDQLEYWAPQVVMGAPFVKILDSSGTTNGSFVGEHSLSYDSPINTWLWTFPDDTTSTGAGTEGDPVLVNFSGASKNGNYFSLRVTNDQGRSHTGYRLMWAFDNLSDLPRVSHAEISGGVENGGYVTQLQVYNLNDDDIAPGAEVVIFEAASYGNTASTLGGNSPFRNNVVMRGWVTNEQINKNPQTGMTILTVETIDGIMKNAPSYDVFYAMIGDGSDGVSIPSGSEWIATSPVGAWMTIDRVAVNMFRWRSTVGDICDFFPAGGIANSWPIVYQNLPRSDWWTQLRTNYNERGALMRVASDMQSSIFAFADPNILGTSATTQQMPTLTASNIGGQVQIERTFHDQTAQVQIYAVASTTPFGAESPGEVFGYAGGKVEHTQGLMGYSQAILTTWSGNIRADMNAEFKRVVTPLAGNMRIDPVPYGLVPISVDFSNHGKRLDWTDKMFIPFESRVTYQMGESVVTELISKEVVDGKGGSAITFPVITNVEPPSAPPPISPPGPTTGTGADIVYVMGDNYLARTTNFNNNNPFWSGTNLGPALG